jgi:formylglycine-generating enzyme required for sulfatase activity
VAKIIISYRRSDSDVFAGRVRDRIAGDFGEDSVFIDVDDIPFGKDFRVYIQEALAKAAAVVVVVGPRWIGTGKGGRSRIMDDTDPVRIEVETALSKGIPIIPILVGQAIMPKPGQLPESLQNFAFINAARVDTGRDFHRDLNRVVASINTILDRPKDLVEAATLSSAFAAESATATAAGHDAERKGPEVQAKESRKSIEIEARSLKRLAGVGSITVAVLLVGIGTWLAASQRWEETPGTMKSVAVTGAPRAATSSLQSFKDCEDCPVMLVVPAGSFMMGSPDSELGRSPGVREGPQQKITFARQFAVAKFPVTFDEWDRCVADGGCNGYKPFDEEWGRGRRPIIHVSPYDAKAYASWLSLKTGHTYRLLSEAEREYITRAGTTTAFWWGSSITPEQANYNSSRRMTLPVDSFMPNPWGFYQVHGNVWDWMQDCWNDSLAGIPEDGLARLTGDCSRQSLRGGAWTKWPEGLRSAFREWSGTLSLPDVPPANRGAPDVTFRVMRTL